METAVYNSPIQGMLKAISFRRVHVFILPILILVGSGWGQDWKAAEEQLAKKIVPVTGPATFTLTVSNQPSLGGSGIGNVDDIRHGLVTQLAALGAHVVDSGQADTAVKVSLSDNLQEYVWVAEIHPSAKTGSATGGMIVMVSLPKPTTRLIQAEAGMVMHKASLWSQQDQILDVAIIERDREERPVHLLVLDTHGVAFYRLQDGAWKSEQNLPITHSQPWPRDLRGRLELQKDRLFDAYLPGVYCRSTAMPPWSIHCSEGDDSWPIGTSMFRLNAAFVSSRNYFSGALLPGVGKQASTAPFYSAAAVPGAQSTTWLFTGIDDQMHVLDGDTDRIEPTPGWGSDMASVHSGCRSGWQVLATKGGDGPTDTVRAFEFPAPGGITPDPEIQVQGRITALWSETGEAGAIAVVHFSETGGYEAFRLTLTCGR